MAWLWHWVFSPRNPFIREYPMPSYPRVHSLTSSELGLGSFASFANSTQYSLQPSSNKFDRFQLQPEKAKTWEGGKLASLATTLLSAVEKR